MAPPKTQPHPEGEKKDRKKAEGPPRYTKSAAAAVSHVEYVLGFFSKADAKRIMDFVSAGAPGKPPPDPPAAPAAGEP